MAHMDKTSPEDKQHDLKRFFASRINHQTRNVLDTWFTLQQAWQPDVFDALSVSLESLLRKAKRIKTSDTAHIAEELLTQLKPLKEANPNDAQLSKLQALMGELKCHVSRSSDEDLDPTPWSRPIFIAHGDVEKAKTLCLQLRYLDIPTQCFNDEQTLLEGLTLQNPRTLIIDVDFQTSGGGIELVKRLRQKETSSLTTLFTYQDQPPSVAQCLIAIRHGGLGAYQENDVFKIISDLEQHLHTQPEPSIKVLMVEDSPSQAAYTQRMLGQLGFEAHAVSNPFDVFDAIHQFNPDVILMDMYLPDCNGIELSRIIRAHEEFFALPIIYLSGEENKQQQMQALAKAGDDFLTKPARPEQLDFTIRNRVKRSKQLLDAIERDSLTGLLNHTHFLRVAEKLLTHPKGQTNANTPNCCLVMIDIDHFKSINDQYGHQVGDTVIRNLSIFLRQSIRKSDPVGRYGGEEFAIALTNTNEQEAFDIMEDLRHRFSQIKHSNDNAISCTFSCGIAQCQGEDITQLVHQADLCLYRAKHQGRNKVCIHTDTLTPQTGRD